MSWRRVPAQKAGRANANKWERQWLRIFFLFLWRKEQAERLEDARCCRKDSGHPSEQIRSQTASLPSARSTKSRGRRRNWQLPTRWGAAPEAPASADSKPRGLQWRQLLLPIQAGEHEGDGPQKEFVCNMQHILQPTDPRWGGAEIWAGRKTGSEEQSQYCQISARQPGRSEKYCRMFQVRGHGSGNEGTSRLPDKYGFDIFQDIWRRESSSYRHCHATWEEPVDTIFTTRGDCCCCLVGFVFSCVVELSGGCKQRSVSGRRTNEKKTLGHLALSSQKLNLSFLNFIQLLDPTDPWCHIQKFCHVPLHLIQMQKVPLSVWVRRRWP